MNVRRYFWFLTAAALLLTAAAMHMLSVPVISVTAQTRDAIRPGMTLAEASKTIGGPPRWYDGIRSFGGGVSGKPNKLYGPTWVSSSGQLVLEADDAGVVTAAAFAPVIVGDQDWSQLWIERLTRGMGERAICAALGVFLGIIAVALWWKGLLGIGAGSIAKDDNAAGRGVWLRVGSCGIGLCTWRKRAPVAN